MKSINFVLASAVAATILAATANAQWRRATEQELGYTSAPRTLVARNFAEPQAPAAPAPRAAEQPAPQTTVRPLNPATAHGRTTSGSGMLQDNARQELERLANLTPITIGKPMAMEQFRQNYGGYGGYGFGNIVLPGMQYPQYSSVAPAQELPCAIQLELREEYRRSGNFNPLLSGTGCDAQNLQTVAEEARIGRGVLREVDGKTKRVQIGPDTWTSTETVVVSSISILDEQVLAQQLNGRDLTQMLDSWGIWKSPTGRKIGDILRSTVGQSQRTSAGRRVIGILYIAKIDVQTRSILDSTTGIGIIEYSELTASDIPGVHTVGVRYAGAGTFARQLVLAALYDPLDRDQSVEKFLQRRGVKTQPQGNTRRGVRIPGASPFTRNLGEAVPDPDRPILRRR